MIDDKLIVDSIPLALHNLELAWPFERRSGKVRESLGLPGERRLLLTTDRLSAFDVVLAAVPFKGQVLNQLSAFWFGHTADIIDNHLLDVPDPNISLVQSCTPLPVEVIVRGYITGSTRTSLWTLYAAGERQMYGYTFPEGLRKNDQLPQPIITPTTKAGPGQHDERLTCAEVTERGFLDVETWEQVQQAALAIFARGQDLAQAAGFCLVDTKYEFGRTPDGRLMLIDEVHTPDSSRFWRSESLNADEPDPWDKEYVRLWYVAQGYRGDGTAPTLPEYVIAEASRRYIALYEGLTQTTFVPAAYPAENRIRSALETFLHEG